MYDFVFDLESTSLSKEDILSKSIIFWLCFGILDCIGPWVFCLFIVIILEVGDFAESIGGILPCINGLLTSSFSGDCSMFGCLDHMSLLLTEMLPFVAVLQLV